MQNSFSRRLGPTRTLYDRRFLSYGQKTTRCLNRAVFKHFLVLQASFYGQNNLQNFLKKLKRCKIHFQEGWDQLELSTINGFLVMAKKPQGV